MDNLDPQKKTFGQENNVFHVAAKSEVNPQAATVQAWLRDHSSLAYQPNNKGDTPLHVAARFGNESFVAVLIDHAKALAAAQGQTNDYYRTLLRKVNHVKENTALHEAVLNGYYHIVKLLIEQDPALTCYVNKAGESPLFLAVEGRFYDIASIILDTFPNCSLLGRNGMTVMHAAVIRSCRPLDRLLLSRNFTRDFDDFVKKVLARCGLGILEKADEYGWMPHHYAANMGQSRVVKLFLKAKRCVAYIKDKKGMTALHISAKNGHIEVIRILMKECPDIGELLDNRDQTALHIAVEHKQVSVVRAFLNERAFVDLINEQDIEGNTALHLAVIHRHYSSIVRLTSNRNTNKRIINEMGMTAFDIIRSSTEVSDSFAKVTVRFCMIMAMIKKDPVLSLQDVGHVMMERVGQNAERAEQTQPKTTQLPRPKDEHNAQDVQHMQNMNLVVSTLIAGITFQAAISMPGAAPYTTSNGLSSFKLFVAFDSMAFGFSSGSLLIHFIFVLCSMLLRRKYRYPTQLTMVFILLSILSFVLAFILGTKALLYEKKELIGMVGTIRSFGAPGNWAMAACYITIIYILIVAFPHLFGIFLLYPISWLHLLKEIRKRNKRKKKKFAFQSERSVGERV